MLRYREVFQQIGKLTGVAINRVHILGCGARNVRLNHWLADALDVPVIAGPFEATARGNALMQLVGLGELHTLREVSTIAQATAVQVYSPRGGRRAAWDDVER